MGDHIDKREMEDTDIWYLEKEGTKRYSELKSLISGTHRMLIYQLQKLEEDLIVHCNVYPVIPQKVEYSLTKEGKYYAST